MAAKTLHINKENFDSPGLPERIRETAKAGGIIVFHGRNCERPTHLGHSWLKQGRGERPPGNDPCLRWTPTMYKADLYLEAILMGIHSANQFIAELRAARQSETILAVEVRDAATMGGDDPWDDLHVYFGKYPNQDTAYAAMSMHLTKPWGRVVTHTHCSGLESGRECIEDCIKQGFALWDKHDKEGDIPLGVAEKTVVNIIRPALDLADDKWHKRADHRASLN